LFRGYGPYSLDGRMPFQSVSSEIVLLYDPPHAYLGLLRCLNRLLGPGLECRFPPAGLRILATQVARTRSAILESFCIRTNLEPMRIG
jgi:hypothetical protein